MPPMRRCRARKRCVGLNACAMQACDEVWRQERAVARRAHDPFDLRRMVGGPVETGQDTGKWSGIIWHAICYDMQTCVGEAARIAVGIDDQLTALRCERRDDALKNCFFADTDAAFIAAADAARAAAGKDKTESGWDVHACFAYAVLRCGLKPLRRHWLPIALCYIDEAPTPSQ